MPLRQDVSWSDAPDNPFDLEGTPRQRVAFIENGRAGRPCFDLRTAARAGTFGRRPVVDDFVVADLC